MRKSILLKLCMLLVVASMVLSLFACNDKNPEVTTDAPTDAPTEAPTQEPTEAPTQAPTEAPTQAPTEAPVVETTEAPVVETTEAPVVETTEAPVDETTEAPADETTEAPADETTEAPADETTEAPADETTEAPADETTEAPVVETTEAPVVETTEAPAVETTEAPVVETTEAPAEETTEAPAEETTEAPNCDEGHTYEVALYDGVWKKACSVCGEVEYNYDVSEEAAGVFLSPEYFLGLATSETATGITGKMNDTEIRYDNGMPYFHMGDNESNHSANGAWNGWQIYDKKDAPNAGQYLAIKVRRPKSSLDITELAFWIISNKSYTNTWADGGFTVPLDGDNEWHTIIIDLAKVSSKFAANDDGTYGVRSVHMRPFGSGSACDGTTDEAFDVAYIAFFDSMDDIKGIVKDTTYELNVNSSTNVEYNMDGTKVACKENDHVTGNPAIADGENGTKVYTYVCLKCDAEFTRTIPASALFIDPAIMGITSTSSDNIHPNTRFQMTALTNGFNGQYPYFGFKGTSAANKTAQFIWNRSAEDVTSASAHERYTIDVGEAKYFVIKARASIAASGALKIYFSTPGVKSVSVNFAYDDYQGDWVTYVLDLEKVIADNWVKDADGGYTLDTFYFHMVNFLTNDSIDIEYMAFVGSDWADVDVLVEEEQVFSLTDKSGAGKWISVADGAEVEAPTEEETTADPEEETTEGEETTAAPEEETTEPAPTCDGSEHGMIVGNSKGHYALGCSICGIEDGPIQPHGSYDVEGSLTQKYIKGASYYTHICTACNYAVKKVELSDAITYYYAGVSFVNTAVTYFQTGAKGVKFDGEMAYGSISGADKTGQILWQRSRTDTSNTNIGQDFENDVGNAKYLIIKIRTNNNAQGISLSMSSTGKDGYDTLNLPMSKLENDTWTVLVIDLENALDEYYAKDEDTDTYRIDTFYFHLNAFASTTSIDVAYIAYVEAGDDAWANIDSVVDEAEVLYVVDKSGTCGVAIVAEGTCKGDHMYAPTNVGGTCKNICAVCGDDAGVTDHTYVATKVDGTCHNVCRICGTDGGVTDHTYVATKVDGTCHNVCTVCGNDGGLAEHTCVVISTTKGEDCVTYAYGCKICGKSAATVTIPNSVNWYSTLAVMNKYSGTLEKEKYDEENGVIYNAFVADASTHWNLTGGGGAGSYTSSAYDSGEYLVIKYRAAGTTKTTLDLYIGTGDKNLSNTSASKIGSLTANAADGWMVSVVKITDPVDSKDGYTIQSEQTLYFMGMPGSDRKLDIAYVAVVDDIAEARELITDSTFIYHGTSLSNAGTAVETATGKCVDDKHSFAPENVEGTCRNVCQVCRELGDLVDHTYVPTNVEGTCKNICKICGNDGGVAEHSGAKTVEENEYRIVCSVCGTVIRDLNVPADASSLFWPAEELYIKATQTGTSASGGSSITGGYVQKEIITEGGETFLRLGDGESNKTASGSWGGWFPISSGGGYKYPGAGRYMVLKVRQNKNSINANSMSFWVTSTASKGNWATGSFSIYLPADDQWHVIVIDLAARSTEYLPDGDGNYGPKTIHLRPFNGGAGATLDKYTDETMDFAYWAFFNDISDIADIVKDEIYEWSVDGSTSVKRYTKDNGCVGDHACAETVDGNTHTIKCTLCGKVIKSFTVDERINYYADLSIMTHYGSKLTKYNYDEKADLFYNSFSATGGCHFDLTGGKEGTAGSWTEATYNTGKYVVIKYRSTVANNLYVGTQDHGFRTGENNPSRTSVMVLPVASAWRTQVVEIPDDCATYTVKSTQQLYFMVGSSAGAMDVAYLAVVDSLDEAILLLNEKENFYLGTAELNQNKECVGQHMYAKVADASADNGYVIKCAGCGLASGVNYISYTGGVWQPNTRGTIESKTDADGFIYNHFVAIDAPHFDLLTTNSKNCNATYTAEAFMTGKYMAIKYRSSGQAIGVSIGSVAADATQSGNATTGGIGSLPISADWQIAIIDLGSAAKYTIGSMQKVALHTANLSKDTVLDVAYVAFADEIADFKGLFGAKDTTYKFYGTSFSSTPAVFDSKTDECFHLSSSLKFNTVGNNFQVACACGKVSYDYNIDKSAAVSRTDGSNTLFRDGFQLTAYTNMDTGNNGAGASFVPTHYMLEAGSPQFTRITPNANATTTAFRGRNMLGGKAATNVNYLVVKFRIGENGLGQTTMKFFAGAANEANSFEIKVSEDNQWHVVVVDLKARAGDGTVFTGAVTDNNEIWYEPLGNVAIADAKAKPTAYVDLAYAAACATLNDVAKLVGGTTYEWSVSATESVVRSTATHEAVTQ